MKKKLLIILVKIVILDYANTTVEWTNRLKKVKAFLSAVMIILKAEITIVLIKMVIRIIN